MPSLASVHWVNLVIAIFTLVSCQQSHSSLLIGVDRYLDSATIDRDPTTESNTVERKYIQDGAMVTIRYNWHQYSERQTIYNIYIINSSNEIMSLLEYQLFSLWDTLLPIFCQYIYPLLPFYYKDSYSLLFLLTIVSVSILIYWHCNSLYISTTYIYLPLHSCY